MPRRRFLDLPPERKDEILKVAAGEFARSGYQATSYNRLLERLKLGKSSAYYYFDDKRDLFLTVIENCYATYFAAMSRIVRPKTAAQFWSFIEQISLEGYRLMLEDPHVAPLVQCVQREQALLGELACQRVLDSQKQFYVDLVREGQALGAVRKDLPAELLAELTQGLSATYDSWFVRQQAKPDFIGLEGSARTFTELARRLCST